MGCVDKRRKTASVSDGQDNRAEKSEEEKQSDRIFVITPVVEAENRNTKNRRHNKRIRKKYTGFPTDSCYPIA